MTFEIDTRDLRAAAAVLRGSSVADTVAEGFVTDLAPEAERAVRLRARRHRRTGQLEASVRTVTVGDGAQRRARIIAGSAIAPIIVGGSRPHTISPRAGRVLSFQVRGVQSFAGRVRHPGTEPDPFVDLALTDLAGAVDAGLATAGEQLVDGLADELNRRV